MDTEVIELISDDENAVPGHRSPQCSSFPKRIGSFRTTGVFSTRCRAGMVSYGSQLIFPIRRPKLAAKTVKRAKISRNDANVIRFLILEGAESLQFNEVPKLQGHYPRNQLEVGKLSASLSKILLPLLLQDVIAISASVDFAPTQIDIFTSIDIIVHVFALPKLFMNLTVPSSENDEEHGEISQIRSNTFVLLRLTEGQSLEDIHQNPAKEVHRQKLLIESLYQSFGHEHQRLPEATPPPSLRCTLRHYQKQALYWMQCREKSLEETSDSIEIKMDPQWRQHTFPDDGSHYYSNSSSLSMALEFPGARPKACGGILGDEMGMGKTVEMISLMATGPRRPASIPDDCNYVPATLVICPMSLLSQWKDEIEKHSDMSVYTFYGIDRDESCGKCDVVLTTYGVVESEIRQKDNSFIFLSFWDRVILDEAHHIKNRKTATAKACFALNARARFLVTGTPIQNNLGDLFSMLHFLREKPWSEISWWNSQIEVPFQKNDPVSLQRLKAILHPLLLRRCKSGTDANGVPLLDLPARDEQIVHVVLSPEERAVYNEVFQKNKTEITGILRQGTIGRCYANVLEMVLRLRQICCHPLLALGYTADAAKQQSSSVNRLIRTLRSQADKADEVDDTNTGSQSYIDNLSSELKSIDGASEIECPICLDPPSDPVYTRCGHSFCRDCSDILFARRSSVPCPICRTFIYRNQLLNGVLKDVCIDLDREWSHSSKTRVLMSELAEFRRSDPKCKTVVFSQWTSMLDIVEKALKEENVSFLRIDGKTSQSGRKTVLKSFCSPESDIPVLLCSLRVGGVGLNLVAASNVILLDIWWNPAVDNQAIDRVHRIGQTKTVRIRRFVVAETIEARILELQNKKIALAEGALQTSDDPSVTEWRNNIVHLFQDFQ